MVNLVIYTNAFVDVTDTQTNVPILYQSLQEYKKIVGLQYYGNIVPEINIFVLPLLQEAYEKLYLFPNSRFYNINQYETSDVHSLPSIHNSAREEHISPIKGNHINLFINCRPDNGFSSHGNILFIHNLAEFETTLCCSNFVRVQLYRYEKSLKNIDYMIQYDPFDTIHNFVSSGSIDTSVLDWDKTLAPNTIVTFRFSNKKEPLYYNGVAFSKLTYTDIDEFKIFLNTFLGGRKNVSWSIAASESIILNLFKFLRKETILTKLYFPESTNIYWFALISCKNLVNSFLLEKIDNSVKLNIATEQMIRSNIYNSLERPLFIPNRNEWIQTALTSSHFTTNSYFYKRITNGYKQYDYQGNYIY